MTNFSLNEMLLYKPLNIKFPSIMAAFPQLLSHILSWECIPYKTNLYKKCIDSLLSVKYKTTNDSKIKNITNKYYVNLLNASVALI